MKTALIGHTGFVGSNLAAQADWDDLYNSKNIHELAGKHYDFVVCAGAPAAKWLINQNPDADQANLQTLQDAIAAADIAELLLISTIDVYAAPLGVYEDTPIDVTGHHAYGLHRLALEQFCTATLPTTVVRLPGLFGKGLKKNVIFDLLHGNQVDRIDPEGNFQYYDLKHLWRDIVRIRQHGLRRVNIATGPTLTQRIASELFGIELAPKAGPRAAYDMRSRYGHVWGRSDDYLYGADEIWADLAAYVAQAQRGDG